jgi:GAF domain-containing protein
MTRRDGGSDAYHFVTAVGSTPETTADALRLKATVLDRHSFVAGRGSITGRVIAEGRTVQIVDLASDPEYTLSELITVGKIRTLLGVPLVREGAVIGTMSLARQRVEPFTERQVELVQTFADQAVVAIENARLIAETHEALEQQTATAEVLQVINSSPSDLAPVFDAMLDKATQLCEAAFGILWICDGEKFHAGALHGAPKAYAEIARIPIEPRSDNPLGRMLRGERLIVSADVSDEGPYRAGDPVRRALVDLAGARSVIQVALVKDETLLGSLTVYRQEVRPFTDRDCAAAKLRGAGGDCDGERATDHRDARGARPADRDRRGAEGYFRIGDRRAAGV